MFSTSIKKISLLVSILLGVVYSNWAQQADNRWVTNEEGGITWNIDN